MNIDINSDLGEGFGIYKINSDEEIMKNISSVNIACGLHGGDPMIMDLCSKKAIELGLNIGAHPGYPDLYGFGRRKMNLSLKEIENFVIYQIAALDGIVRKNGGEMNHVKLHGALYNEAAKNYEISDVIIKAIKSYNRELLFFAMSNSEMEKSAIKNNMNFVREFFADRAYEDDGFLVSRSKRASVIHDKKEIGDRIITLIGEKKVKTISGKYIDMEADSICVHGDTKEAVEIAEYIKSVLNKNNIIIKGF